MPSYPLSETAFAQAQRDGWFNLDASYQDYLAMIADREKMKRELAEAARRDGYELGAPQMELTSEDEAILERVWAEFAAKKAADEQERLSRVA